jgi:hypothetical protein
MRNRPRPGATAATAGGGGPGPSANDEALGRSSADMAAAASALEMLGDGERDGGEGDTRFGEGTCSGGEIGTAATAAASAAAATCSEAAPTPSGSLSATASGAVLTSADVSTSGAAATGAVSSRLLSAAAAGGSMRQDKGRSTGVLFVIISYDVKGLHGGLRVITRCYETAPGGVFRISLRNSSDNMNSVDSLYHVSNQLRSFMAYLAHSLAPRSAVAQPPRAYVRIRIHAELA